MAPEGEIGSAPPTNAPNRLRELRIEISAISRKPMTSGRLKIPNQWLVLTGVSKSSSSLASKTEVVETCTFSGNSFERIASTTPSDASRICDQRGGINSAITRADTNRCFLRTLRALISAPGLIIKAPTAKISSAAYPGSFAIK